MEVVLSLARNMAFQDFKSFYPLPILKVFLKKYINIRLNEQILGLSLCAFFFKFWPYPTYSELYALELLLAQLRGPYA